jgi:galactose mutarotase-like enzyme
MSFEPVTLAAHGSRIEIVPTLGGKIASLQLGGREWLWTSDVLPWTAPDERLAADDEASYVQLADTGGYDECLPTVGACRLPADVPGVGGLALPDHGELWSQHAPTERVERAGEPELVTRWRGRRMAYTFARAVAIEADGAVRMRYTLESRATMPLPFLWSSHPLLPLTPDTRLELPIAARVRVWAQHGIDLGGERAEHRWPVLRVRDGGRDGGKECERDFTRPARDAAPYACKLFLDLPRPAGGVVRLAVEQDDARLEVEVDAREVPNLGLWLNHGGWTPFADRRGYHNLAFEPCIGAPDPLDAALGEWHGAAWLAPSETRQWTLRWRGRRRMVAG